MMKNNKYHTISLSKGNILVVLRSWESMEYYLDEIESDLSSSNCIFNVYFDLLVKNGLRNRFFKADFVNGKIDFKTFTKIDVSKDIEEKSNEYFAWNIDILEESVLTKAQKFLYKREIELAQ